MRPGYSDHDAARLLTEPPKRGAPPDALTERRGPFARDRARVLHCAALRRLAGKTQVVGPGEGDVPRTRLTHSLEVAQIGRGIGEELGCDPDVVDTAGLAHDIGHPPFGHNGERALNEIARPCGGFEGNAQTLRILTRLEPKVLGPDGVSFGLNLTRASLDAATKYPWPRRDGQAKYGVYADDLPVFTWLREGAPGERRCLEAQIMDWADDVAYSVHDVEDGVLAGRISLRALTSRTEREAIAELAAAHFSAEPVAALAEAAAELLALPAVADLVAHDHDGSFAAQVALKRLTSELVGRFAAAAVTGTRRRYGDGPLHRYTADLVVLPRVAAEVAVLKAMALRYVMSDPRRLAMQREQRELLTELVVLLAERAPDGLDPLFRPAWQAAASDADRLRVVVDQVALLTDAQAHAWHARLTNGVRQG
ncbi:dGTPase [Streptoalloteichus tenebrarius]|uniref:Deoxyguanosinetriphosphate triphosphohydrolase-like protein n=1 Tax=Streptoalloteichus tenebrarius (strain ATCC 17920 / DSM 40477 / JCM 4838 / CBS 697.72 / NBRC 16177 / NCIMB 11028 / NRRL B-12390 / A12253. 1 / ISP 5477) TaxID=1933 RepID=A0ABT1I3V7_STRSD|nr:deoxyguanosinetriphosphate triphosphohydrolase [Streptoalloteichus tenebrarius]MCP2262444.1 dGTPase [Streptoalloteichus tenebrarius]BFF00434.1 deoxyguanosinetriphosphate triphosphohydrolase [Streptoalloteichus tenebrarius]